MKKTRLLAVIPLAAGIAVSIAPLAFAQKADIAQTAQKACEDAAVSKGFKVDNVVSITPKGTDGADVILTLSRDGHPAKLTCGWTKGQGAAFGDLPIPKVSIPTTAIPVPKVAADPFNPWGWLLALGAIAAPLYLKRAHHPVVAEGAAGHLEAYVDGHGNRVNVHDNPSATSTIIGSLEDGHRVFLSGRTDNNWSQLREGGWITTRSLKHR